MKRESGETARAGRAQAAPRNARRFISYLHAFDAVRIVGADSVAGGGGDVAGTGIERLESLFRALGFDDAPAGVVEGDGIASDQESVEGPRPLRHVGGSAFVLRGHGIADGETDLVADGRQHVDVGDIGVAGVGVVLVRIVYRSEQVLEGDGHAGDAVILEHGHVDDAVADAGDGLREQAAGAAVDGEILFVAEGVVAGDAGAAGAVRDAEAGAFEVFAEAVEDDDVFGGDARLTEPLRYRLDQGGAGGGRSASRQAIHFESDDFAGARDLFPGLEGGVAIVEGLHGAVEQGRERGVIARDDDPGAGGRRGLGGNQRAARGPDEGPAIHRVARHSGIQ